jgi:hypothetical protein
MRMTKKPIIDAHFVFLKNQLRKNVQIRNANEYLATRHKDAKPLLEGGLQLAGIVGVLGDMRSVEFHERIVGEPR